MTILYVHLQQLLVYLFVVLILAPTARHAA
jgi:hypothetical protein